MLWMHCSLLVHVIYCIPLTMYRTLFCTICCNCTKGIESYTTSELTVTQLKHSSSFVQLTCSSPLWGKSGENVCGFYLGGLIWNHFLKRCFCRRCWRSVSFEYAHNTISQMITLSQGFRYSSCSEWSKLARWQQSGRSTIETDINKQESLCTDFCK